MTRARGGRRTTIAAVWTDRAFAELEAIGARIARDRPAVAYRWMVELIALAEKAAAMPGMGRRVPELARDDVREVLRGPYRLVYRVSDGRIRIRILTVFEGHRSFPDDLL